MELPDLSGQPAWVVIVVFGLFAVAGVAGVLVRRRRKESETESEVEAHTAHVRTASLPVGGITDAPIVAALQHLADAAKADREEAAEARGESERARKSAEKARAEVTRLQGEVTRMAADISDLRIRLLACEQAARGNHDH